MHALTRSEIAFCAVVLGIVAMVWLSPAIALSDGLASAFAKTIVLLAFLFLAGVTPVLTSVDLAVHRLPNAIVLPAFCVGVVLLGTASALTRDGGAYVRAWVGCLALGAFYLLLAVVHPGGMGFGDVKLAAVLGLFLGWQGWGPLLLGSVFAFVLGGLVGVVMLIFRRADGPTTMAFGPWMLGGAWLGIALAPAAMTA